MLYNTRLNTFTHIVIVVVANNRRRIGTSCIVQVKGAASLRGSIHRDDEDGFPLATPFNSEVSYANSGVDAVINAPRYIWPVGGTGGADVTVMVIL
mgnify:CR=1 FL=1